MRHRPAPPPGPYLIVGLARSGLAAGLALRERGAEVIAVDAGRPEGTAELAGAGAEVHLESDGLDLLGRAGSLIKSPGVPAAAPVVAGARERGLPVIGELELGWRLLPNEFIAVTGTNGKTTTVELIGHIHDRAGLPSAVAGNVGTALSSLARSLQAQVVVVCEASSFQLEDAEAFAPEAALLLNVTPDHADRHSTMSSYLEAKLRIFANQGPEDLAIVSDALARPGARLEDGTPVGLPAGAARTIRFGTDLEDDMSLAGGLLRWRGEPLIAASEIGLRGNHNLENAMAAAAACLARGVAPELVAEGLRSFPGVRHRLEAVARRDGVLYVNDSKATNVASTLVALAAFAAEAGRLHLILGGRGKGQDFSPLREPAARLCRAVYLIGEDAPVIAGAIDAPAPQLVEDLARAVTRARAQARPGDVVLLSPACASFDQFSDFEARGERFRELVG